VRCRKARVGMVKGSRDRVMLPLTAVSECRESSPAYVIGFASFLKLPQINRCWKALAPGSRFPA
jgi:hypothetical protein